MKDDVPGRWRQDTDWQDAYATYLDPPGASCTEQLVARIRAIWDMHEIEIRHHSA